MTHALSPIALAAALFCLAGCEDQPAPTPPAKPVETAATIEGAAVTDPKLIPPAFQGSWAVTEAECENGETRVDIESGGLAFPESTGAASTVTATGPDEIRITVKLAGEGALSQRSFRYRLRDGGQTLVDVRNGLTRTRCPRA